MSRVYHIRTNVAGWQCAELALLDEALQAAGSTPIDLPWDRFELCEDGDHFTTRGALEFAHALGMAVPLRGAVVVADSTIGHNGELSANVLRNVYGARSVDAVCGSGFMARAWNGEHFRARVRRHTPPPPAAVVLVGGWNDTWHRVERACAAAQACVTAAGGEGRRSGSR